jgi:hypothetical protein
MKNFLEELKNYFDNTPQTVLEADWAESVEDDKIGPTVEDFLSYTKLYLYFESCLQRFTIKSNKKLNPEFTPGFLLHKSYN